MGGSSKKRRRREAAELADKQAKYDSYSADRTQSLNTARDAYMDFKAELEGRKQRMAEGASAYEAKTAQWQEKNAPRVQELKDRHGVHVDPVTGRRRTANYKVGYGQSYDPEREIKYLERYSKTKKKDGSALFTQENADRMMRMAMAYGDEESQRDVHEALKKSGFDVAYNEKKAIDDANVISEADKAKKAELKATYDAEAPLMSFADWEAKNYGSGG
ncbi:MAG: hypothetical protein AAFO91_03365 [Bacteroidota bacterium]